MHFIQKQDDLSVRIGDLFQYGFQAFFELTAVLGACHQRAHIQLNKAFVLETLGHISVYDALGQPFHDGGLPDTRFANQGRVVLGATGKDLNCTADLLIATDDRVEFALAGHSGQIQAIFFQRLESAFGILGADALGTAHLF